MVANVKLQALSAMVPLKPRAVGRRRRFVEPDYSPLFWFGLFPPNNTVGRAVTTGVTQIERCAGAALGIVGW